MKRKGSISAAFLRKNPAVVKKALSVLETKVDPNGKLPSTAFSKLLIESGVVKARADGRIMRDYLEKRGLTRIIPGSRCYELTKRARRGAHKVSTHGGPTEEEIRTVITALHKVADTNGVIPPAMPSKIVFEVLSGRSEVGARVTVASIIRRGYLERYGSKCLKLTRVAYSLLTVEPEEVEQKAAPETTPDQEVCSARASEAPDAPEHVPELPAIAMIKKLQSMIPGWQRLLELEELLATTTTELCRLRSHLPTEGQKAFEDLLEIKRVLSR